VKVLEIQVETSADRWCARLIPDDPEVERDAGVCAWASTPREAVNRLFELIDHVGLEIKEVK